MFWHRARSFWVERVGHRTAEVVFLSYPKAGSTWLRYLLGKYVQRLRGDDLSTPPPLFDEYVWWGGCRRHHPGFPTLRFTHGGLAWEEEGQTADDLSPELLVHPFRGKRVVHLVRSVPDILCSLHAHKKHQEKVFDGSVEAFIDDSVFGLEKAIRFFQIWDAHRGEAADYRIVRYEDLRAETLPALRGLLGFLGAPADEAAMAAAIEDASFDRMRRLEVEEKKNPRIRWSSGLTMFAEVRGEKTADSFHVRRGKVGGYRDSMSPDAVARLERRLREALPPSYGYAY